MMVKRRLHLLLLSWLSTSCCCYCSMPTSSRKNRWGPHLTNENPTTTALQGASSSSSASSSSTSTTEELDTAKAAAATCSVTTRDVLSLESIRSSLIRQEETIIFALIERAQFRQNPIVYQRGGFGDLGLPVGCCEDAAAKVKDHDDEQSLSFLEYMLLGTEVLHCRVRRYTSPEEHAFFPDYLSGPLSALKQLDYPQEVLLSSDGLANQINFNPLLLQYYIHNVVPSLSVRGDDEQHGSTVLCDIAALQALSRRIHYGKFVAESKYQSNPQAYQKLIDENDDAAVMALLTDPMVERKVLLRARLKATTYGREPLVLSNLLSKDIMDGYYDKHNPTSEDTDDLTTLIAATAAASAVVAALDALQQQRHPVNGNDSEGSNKGETSQIRSSTSSAIQALRPKVDPMVIESIYRDIIIPLTKDVEVAYLFRRCGREPPAQYNVAERMKLLQQQQL